MENLPYIARIEREDKQRMSCIIMLPEYYVNINQFDDSLDETIDNQIMDKIYFEGQGFSILEIIPFKLGNLIF